MVGASALTKPPTNLKDAIDWILWFWAYGRTTSSGMSNYTKLANALNTLPEFVESKETALGRGMSPEGVINKLGTNLGSRFLGYVSQGGGFNFSGDGIVKNGGGYESAYRDAQWEEGSKSEYVEIFLAVVPFVFWSMAYLYWKCKIGQAYGGWADESLNASSHSGLSHFILIMGFTPTQLRNINGSDVSKLLDSGYNAFEELGAAYATYILYDSFITTLEQNGPQNAIDRPLSCCYLLTRFYCQHFKQKQESDESLTKVRKKLEAFRKSSGNSAPDIKYQIDSFISTYMTAASSSTTGNAVPSSSTGGPIAGTLATLGLGGAATASYLFNLGGAKTLVNGLLRIG
ncbi:uncharacterized protein BcabD6B2_46220 [Babesia caballi]|uniref:Uncharacterized protein n=1 Tax=Babesia caballi TaxID=5871 RepID=A0AAV4LZX9_BABCB|nr:hypothetical protein, conserved [Babesia caballi]